MSKKFLLILLIGSLAVFSAAGQSDEMGGFLVGEFEGPTIITDMAMMPESYSESPMLSAMVAAGDLPPVEERLPANPGVIQPAHEIGVYGGQWRRGYTGPGDVWNARRIAGNDNLLFMDYTLNEIKPWVFEAGKPMRTSRSSPSACARATNGRMARPSPPTTSSSGSSSSS